MKDPNFTRSVVLVIEHRAGEGTLGVILNRPGELVIADVLPGWEHHVIEPHVCYQGGPVERQTAICIGVVRDATKLSIPPLNVITVQWPVVLIDLDTDPEVLAATTRGMRIFAGYGGWNPDQLDQEIARGDWIVVDSLPDDVLCDSKVDLWARVLRRQGGSIALLATYPANPMLN